MELRSVGPLHSSPAIKGQPFHAVDLDERRPKTGCDKDWQMRYTAAIMLLYLENPAHVTGICKSPLLAPEMDYECQNDFYDQVAFPGGMNLKDSGKAKMYYGATDPYVYLATANVDDLLTLCDGSYCI